MPRLAIRTIGVATVPSTLTRPLSISGFNVPRSLSTMLGSVGAGGGGTGWTIAARVTCGMRDGGAARAWACRPSDAAFSPVETQKKQAPAARDGGSGGHPHRQSAAGGPIGRGNALPAPRQVLICRFPLGSDYCVCVRSQDAEFARVAALGLPIMSHEAERQAQIHQFDHRQKLVRVLPQLPELIEELIGAAGAMVEHSHEWLRGPAAGRAPGC